MAFDLSTAEPVKGFDISTAKPVQDAVNADSAERSRQQGLLRNFAHGASFGFDDELAGLVSAATGGDYQSAKNAYARERDAYSRENPKASFAANVVGSVASAPALLEAAGALPGAARGAAALAKLSRPAQAALAGGAFGAAAGAGDAEEGHRLEGALLGGAKSAAIGAVLSPVASAAGRLFGSAAESSAGRAAPTAAELREAAGSAYTRARGMGVEVSADAADAARGGAVRALQDAGYRDYLAPKTFRAVAELGPLKEGGTVTLADVEGVRRALNKAAADPAEKDAARRAIDHLDDWLENLGPEHVVAGDATQAASVLGEARANYAAAKRAELIDTATEKAQRQAGSAGSGGNIDNAMRQQIKSLLNNPKKLRGFSPDEVAQMEQIVRGTFTGNAARLLGKLAPTGVVSSALSGGAGLALGGGPGAVALPLLGFAGKKFGDASTRRLIESLGESVRARSPLAALSEIPGPPNPLANLLPLPQATAAAIAGPQVTLENLRRLRGDQTSIQRP